MNGSKSSNRFARMNLHKIYFWTATINKWRNLLWEDEFKDIVINSLEYLTRKNKIKTFGFVVMPNHFLF